MSPTCVEQRDDVLLVADIADDVAAGQDVGGGDLGAALAKLADEARADAARRRR